MRASFFMLSYCPHFAVNKHYVWITEPVDNDKCAVKQSQPY